MNTSQRALPSTENVLAEAGFKQSDVIQTEGHWPLTLIFINQDSGTLDRELVGYFDVFLPTRAITLHERTGDMRRKKFSYKRGMIGFNPPETRWSIDWQGRMEGVGLIFEKDVLQRAAIDLFGDNPTDLKWRMALSDNMPAIAYLGLDIASQISEGYPAGRTVVDQQVLTFIGMLVRRYASTDQRNTAKVGIRSPQVLRALSYIDANLTAPITTDHICDIAASSPSHLNKLFRKEIGNSVWNYVISRRMLAAAQEIEATHFTIDVIAKSYSFASRSTFSNQFKSHYGMSPGQYRRSKQLSQSDEV